MRPNPARCANAPRTWTTMAALLTLTGLTTATATAAPASADTSAGQNNDEQTVTIWQPRGPIGDVPDDRGTPAQDDGRYFPLVLEHDSVTYAAFMDNRNNDPYGYRNPDIMLRTSTDDGDTWGTLRNLSEAGPAEDGLTGMAHTDTSVLVSYTTSSTENTGVYPDKMTYLRITGPGGRDIQRITGTTPVFNGALGGADGHYYQVGGTRLQPNLNVARSTDDGRTWEEPLELPAADCFRAENPAVGADGPHVVVAWTDPCSGGQRGDTWAVTSNDHGSTWSAAVNLSRAPQSEYPPAVHVSDGQATVLWQTLTGDTSRRLDSATIDLMASTPTWSAPATVDSWDSDRFSMGIDYTYSPWMRVRLSHDGTGLIAYPPTAPTYYRSTDNARSFTVAGHAPDQGRMLTHLHHGDEQMLAWRATDTESWTSAEIVPAAPAAPTDLVAKGRRGKVNLSWTAPADNGGAISRYDIQLKPKNIGRTTTETKISIRLRPGSYKARVSATNQYGQSTPSAWTRFRIR